MYLLFARDGGVDAFCADIGKIYGPAMITDLKKEVASGLLNLRRQEPVLMGYLARKSADPTAVPRVAAAQNYTETQVLQLRHLLSRQPPVEPTN
jgi:hypothetical protein